MPLLLCVALVACADDDGDRRFANEPPPTADAATTPTVSGGVQVTPTSTGSAASPVAVTHLLASPGGVSTIVVQVGEDLVVASPPWSNPRTIWSAADGQVLAYAATPAADIVAVLVAGETESRVDLVLLGPDGTELRRVEDLGQYGGPPPAPEATTGRYGLDWSPDGAQVLIGLAPGGILAVPRSGDPQLLIGPSRAPAPGQVTWSPRGDAIAFISPAARKVTGGLYVAPTGAVPLDPVPVVPPSAGGRSTVSRFAWSPDGTSLYYTVASTTGDPSFGGDLFQIPAAGGTPQLVATASRVGPVSAITDFAVSPDGTGVAYVVTIPADNGQPTDSLWLQPIGASETQRLPLDPSERVTGLWWTTDGLIWQATPITGKSELVLYRAKDGETPGVVFRSSGTLGTPVATAATSEASPAASPVAASPVVD